MPQDDLYGLAQSAGIVPANDEGGGYYAGVDEPGVPGVPTSPMGLEGRQPVMPGSLTPPAVAPMPGDLTGLPAGLQSEGSSFGHTGFNQSTHDRLATLGGATPSGLGGEVDKATLDAQQKAGAEADRMLAPLREARAEGDKAAADTALAQADIQHQNGIEAAHFAQLNSDFAAQEAKANADADAAANTAKANYTASLMDLRASRVDPNELWKSQAGAGQFGMLVSAFVHDFLGAKGIHTSAMDTFNKAIDRNIDAQVNAIKVKGEVTAGFKTMWDMQRAQSASDTEARTRMKGILLESATQQATAHMAQYQSALATAQGHAALAKLHEESAKTIIDVYKHVDDNTNALRKQNLDVLSDNKKYAIESDRAAIDRARLKLEQANAKKNSSDNVIINPETGLAEWEYAPNLEPGEQKTTRDMLANKTEMSKAFGDLRTLMRENPATLDMIQGTRFAGTGQQRYDSVIKRMAHSMVHGNGERATDSDVQDYIQGMRPNTWANRADADKVIAQTEQMMMRETDAYLQQRARDLPANDPRRTISGARAPAFRGVAADTNATLHPVPPTREQEDFDSAVKAIKEPSDKIDRGAGKTSADPWDQFNKEDLDSVDSGDDVRTENNRFLRDNFNKSAGVTPLRSDLAEAKLKGYNTANDDLYRPKQFEAGMVRLRDLAKEGKPESQAAINELAKWALGPIGPSDGTGDQDDYRGLFALQMLHEISDSVANPDAVRQEAKKAGESK